ncbi:MAG: hypothetical protein NVSMB19_12990 [Vulcanimicrobiaceae bacterium]
MAASASLTIPLALASPAQTYDATRIFEATPGLSGLAFDVAGGTARVRLEFPGNLDALMRRLVAKRLTSARSIAISIPVQNLTGRIVDPAKLLGALNASPAITGAAYDGKTVAATIVPATNAVRYLYEEIIIAGLMPLDVPTVAGPLEFVL